MVIVTAQGRLERRPPRVEARLRIGREAQERALRRGELLGPEGGQVEGGELPVDGEGARPGLGVRPSIDVAPPRGRIGEHRELKPWQQAVVPPAREGLLQVGGEGSGLDAPEYRDTSGLNAQGAPP